MNVVEVAAQDGGVVGITSAQLDELDASFTGPVLRAGDRGWDAAARAGGGSPALILQPTSARDLASAIAFARALHLALAVAGGSPGVAGAVLLDLTRLGARAASPDGPAGRPSPRIG